MKALRMLRRNPASWPLMSTKHSSSVPLVANTTL